MCQCFNMVAMFNSGCQVSGRKGNGTPLGPIMHGFASNVLLRAVEPILWDHDLVHRVDTVAQPLKQGLAPVDHIKDGMNLVDEI